jgi:hypothetical protein
LSALFDVGYLQYYGRDGIKVIKKHLCANPRIIICLRDPIDRIISDYQMRVRTISKKTKQFVENLDFHEALAMEDERKKQNPDLYMYIHAYTERSIYSEDIKHCIEEFGIDNIHIVLMEDELKTNTRLTIAKLFNFISMLDKDGLKISTLAQDKYIKLSRSPKQINVSLILKNGDTLNNPISIDEETAKNVIKLIVRSDSPVQLNIDLNEPDISAIESAIKLKKRHSIQLSLDEKRYLYEKYFKDDIEKLERLINRDLSSWYAHYYN